MQVEAAAALVRTLQWEHELGSTSNPVLDHKFHYLEVRVCCVCLKLII